jgi:hypothetical protein
MKRPFMRRSPISLRHWVSLCMSALAVGAVISIALCMWLRFAIWDFYTMHQADRDRIGQVCSGGSMEIAATVAEKRLLLEIADRGPGARQ